MKIRRGNSIPGRSAVWQVSALTLLFAFGAAGTGLIQLTGTADNDWLSANLPVHWQMALFAGLIVALSALLARSPAAFGFSGLLAAIALVAFTFLGLLV